MSRVSVLSTDQLKEETEHFFAALNEADDFGMVLMSTGFLDEALKSLLWAKVVEGFADELSRNLGTLARRTNACAALGLITPVMHNNINLIRHIRNRFAHSHRSRSFEDEEVARHCRNLEFPHVKSAFRIGFDESKNGKDFRWPGEDIPRERFRLVVMNLGIRIHLSVLGASRLNACSAGWESQ